MKYVSSCLIIQFQVGKLVVENAELQQQVSTLRAKLEKTAKKLSKTEEKKKKKAYNSDILVSSPVSDSDMSTELELSQVKDLCMQLQEQNDVSTLQSALHV